MSTPEAKYTPMNEPEVSSQPPPAYNEGARNPVPVMSQPMGQASAMAAPGYYPMPMMSNLSHNSNTTIINQQQQPMNLGPRQWSSGVMDCCHDMGICCFGLFCGCCQATQLATDMGESCCVPCCVPGWLIVLRAKLRAHHNITGSVMDDCCTSAWCGPCVMCQLAREIKMLRMTNQSIIQNRVV